jgi:predicted HicB family RNase H-like nuclease
MPPPATRPRAVQINLRIPEPLLEQLDHEARSTYLTRNALVLQILNAHLRPDA